MQILAERPQGLGYLLKDRVTDIEEFAGTLRRVAGGGSALDPKVVTELLARPPDPGRWPPSPRASARCSRWWPRGAQQGRRRPAQRHERAVRKHVTAIFEKLGLVEAEDDNRRILAVLEFLRPDGIRTRSVAAEADPRDTSRLPTARPPGWDLSEHAHALLPRDSRSAQRRRFGA